MDRGNILEILQSESTIWDVIIIGGGASGLGVAVDAANRGLKTLLLERYDFGKGTSTRSTKLIHGGVRYLEQGNITLVRDALKERGALLENAPHLVSPQPFLVPTYSLWEKFYFGVGLKVYDFLAGKNNIHPSSILSRDAALKATPDVSPDNLKGGITYYDAQFDDARLSVNLAQTAVEQGATLLNYVHVKEVHSENGIVSGVGVIDTETNRSFNLKTRTLINATGPFSDSVRKMADSNSESIIQPSQGVHVVLDRSFYTSDTAFIIPKTKDGRVLFAIPWHNVLIAGTTDTPVDSPIPEPDATSDEIEFILEHLGIYLNKAPQRSDILSTFTGLRPLVKTRRGTKTSAISRDHTIEVSPSGLITIAGGKWTTYRKMAEDTVDRAMKVGELVGGKCETISLKIHGHRKGSHEDKFRLYGSDADGLKKMIDEDPVLGTPMHSELPICPAQILWAIRHEMARTIEDVLSRRTRCLLINARASLVIAPEVGRLMAEELGEGEDWQGVQLQHYSDLTSHYLPRD